MFGNETFVFNLVNDTWQSFPATTPVLVNGTGGGETLGYVSTLAHVPGLDLILQVQVIQTVCMIICTWLFFRFWLERGRP